LLSLTSHSLLQAFEDGTDTWFRNVGKLQIDAGEIPKRTYTIFKSRRKLEIKKTPAVVPKHEGVLILVINHISLCAFVGGYIVCTVVDRL
jgi:hypothetical protein